MSVGFVAIISRALNQYIIDCLKEIVWGTNTLRIVRVTAKFQNKKNQGETAIFGI